MKRYKVKYATRVCKLGSLKRKYAQIEKLDLQDMYKQVLLEEMQLRIKALEYILG